MILKDKFRINLYQVFILGLILFFWFGKLHTNAHLFGMPISTVSNLVSAESADSANAALSSANLPGYYIYHILYKYFGLSDAFVKAFVILFAAVVAFIAIYRISAVVFRNEASGIFALIVTIFSSFYYSTGAPNPLLENNLATLSVTFILLSILLWLKGSYKLSALIIGFSFDCHPIYPIAFIIVFFLYLIARYKTVSVKTIVLSFLIFILVTLPVTYSVIKSVFFVFGGVADKAFDAELIWRYIRFAQPEHAFIDIKPEFHIGFSIYIASLLFLSLFYMKEEDKFSKEVFLKLFVLVLTVCFFSIFDNLNSYHFRIIPLFNLKFSRFASYGSMMVYIVLTGAVTHAVRSAKINNIIRLWIFLLLVIAIVNPRSTPFLSYWLNHLFILEAVIIYYLYNYFHAGQKLPLTAAATGVVLLVLSVLYFYYIVLFSKDTHNVPVENFFTAQEFGRFWVSLQDIHFNLKYAGNVKKEFFYIFWMKVIALSALLLICIIQIFNCTNSMIKFDLVWWHSFTARIKKLFYPDSSRKLLKFEIMNVLFVLVLIALSVIGFKRLYAMDDFKDNIIFKYEMPMKEWVKLNTPKDAKFLIPLYINSWFDTNRYSFYDVNIINDASYNKSFLMDAIKRFEILTGLDLKNMTEAEMSEISPLTEDWGKRNDVLKKRYNEMPVQKILEFRDKYNIDFFITSSGIEYPFHVVYQNKAFKIYKIRDRI